MVVKIAISLLFIGFIGKVVSQDSLGYYHGIASYYNFKGHGNCSFQSPSKPILTAAVNSRQYNFAMLCGACLQVIGSLDTVIVRVEDRCPGCKFGGIDLSKTAFAIVEDMKKGRAEVRWKVVPCKYSKPIKVYVRKHHNNTATFVVVNHNTPIKSVSIWDDSTWVIVDRQKDNCYHVKINENGYVRLQMNDWYGNDVVSDSLFLKPGMYIDLNKQFGQ